MKISEKQHITKNGIFKKNPTTFQSLINKIEANFDEAVGEMMQIYKEEHPDATEAELLIVENKYDGDGDAFAVVIETTLQREHSNPELQEKIWKYYA